MQLDSVGDVKTRDEVLRAVAQQAKARLKRRSNDASASEAPGFVSSGAWGQEQWYAAFEYLFFTDAHPGHDDLLFLVKTEEAGGRSRGRASPDVFTVIRRTKEVPSNLRATAPDFPRFAWADTVLLNLVLHGTYRLTVTTCRQELLAHVADGLDVKDAGGVSVTRQVYACPSHATVNLRAARADAPPQPSYPDIYFVVDNFDDVFMDSVLHSPDDCFCVVLRAEVGEAQKAGDGTNAAAASIVIFSGYVVHQQIQDHLGPKLHTGTQPAFAAGLLRRVFNARANQERKSGTGARHHVAMNGPGGLGRAEVAVAVAAAADTAVKGDSGDGTPAVPPLQCALLSVSLPVSVLAQQVLHVHTEPQP